MQGFECNVIKGMREHGGFLQHVKYVKMEYDEHFLQAQQCSSSELAQMMLGKEDPRFPKAVNGKYVKPEKSSGGVLGYLSDLASWPTAAGAGDVSRFTFPKSKLDGMFHVLDKDSGFSESGFDQIFK